MTTNFKKVNAHKTLVKQAQAKTKQYNLSKHQGSKTPNQLKMMAKMA